VLAEAATREEVAIVANGTLMEAADSTTRTLHAPVEASSYSGPAKRCAPADATNREKCTTRIHANGKWKRSGKRPEALWNPFAPPTS